MGTRVRLVEINGEKRVPPDVMDLLISFAHHRDFCNQCGTAYKKVAPAESYCHIGYEILQKLTEQPEVSND